MATRRIYAGETREVLSCRTGVTFFARPKKVTKKRPHKGVQGATPAVSLVAVGAHNDGILMAPP